MQLSSSLGGAPVSPPSSPSGSTSGAGHESRSLHSPTQPVNRPGVVVHLSAAAEAFLQNASEKPKPTSGNPLAPAGLQDAMDEVELFGVAEEADLPGVFQVYEGPAQKEAQATEESAAPEIASESKPVSELTEEELAMVEELKARDAEVRAHELAHLASAGGLAGAPVFSYQTGPDGRRYAIGGSVSIDTSSEGSPEETIAKAQRIRSAALAPGDPSAADRAVAARAARMESQARQMLARRQAEEAQTMMEAAASSTSFEDGSAPLPVSGAETVDTADASEVQRVRPPRRAVSSVIPGGIATLAGPSVSRMGTDIGPSTLRTENRPSLHSFSGGSAAVAQLYTPDERVLEAAFAQFAS